MFLFCLVFAMFCARLFICALWSPAGKGLTSWLSFVVSSVSCHFPIGILGQVWYLIVSIPDLCNLITFIAIISSLVARPISNYVGVLRSHQQYFGKYLKLLLSWTDWWT